MPAMAVLKPRLSWIYPGSDASGIPMEINEMKLKTTNERMKNVSLPGGVFAAGIGSPVDMMNTRIENDVPVSEAQRGQSADAYAVHGLLAGD
jgi:hypothetical protein